MAGEIPQREFEDGISVLTIGIGGSHLGDATTEPEAERIVDEA